MQLRTLFLSIGFMVLPTAHSAVPNGDLDVSVKFDRSFYQLKSKSGMITYKEGGLIYQIKIQDCNRAVIAKIADRYWSLSSTQEASEVRPKQSVDINVTSGDGKKQQVARGSAFGTWLRELPRNVMYLSAEARVLCKR
jgi:hypothetical protein